MPYADATWDDAFFDEMRQTHDRYGQSMFWWAFDRWKQGRPDAGDRPLDLAADFLDEYWLPHYKLDQPELITNRPVELVMPNPPEPGANPVSLPDDVRDLGQQLFWDHGLEILMLLACYSLPAAYGAYRGVKVLAGTRYLSQDPNHRLMETSQLVINVLSPGGLDPVDMVLADGRGTANPVPELRPGREAFDPTVPGSGIRMARMVRLLHAGVRPYVQMRDENFDKQRDGKAINQEDLAATLMTFGWVVLDGLRKLKVEVDRETKDAYIRIWAHIGHEVGVDHRLLPLDFDEAEELTARIRERQVIPSETRKHPEGPYLTDKLIGWMRDQVPLPMRPMPAAMMRICLEPEHRDVADALGVPRPFFTLQAAKATLALQAASGFPMFRIATRIMVRRMRDAAREGRPAFVIPPSLAKKWGVPGP